MFLKSWGWTVRVQLLCLALLLGACNDGGESNSSDAELSEDLRADLLEKDSTLEDAEVGHPDESLGDLSDSAARDSGTEDVAREDNPSIDGGETDSARPCEEDQACDPEEYCQEGYCQPGCREGDLCAPGPRGQARGCTPLHECQDLWECCDRVGECELLFECDERGCAEDRPCGGRMLCMENGECIEPGECLGDEDCRGERRCILGLCDDLCEEDADCPGSRRCVEGLCPEPARCLSPRDCDLGRLCLDGLCEDPCGAESPCPGMQICEESGRCAEPERCTGEDDCLRDRRCLESLCDDPCEIDADCSGSRRCVEGRCPEPEICRVPADCDPGRICLRERCVAPCEGDESCPGLQRCGEEGRCQEPESCAADGDCLDIRICEAERCREPCVEDTDCAGSRRCVEGRCPEMEICFSPLDCDPGRVCWERSCVEACDEERPCPGLQRCALESGLCLEPQSCQEDLDCLDVRVCDQGICEDPCLEDADCAGSRSCDLLSGRCPEPEICVVSEDCDPGRSCISFNCTSLCGEEQLCPGLQRCDLDTGLCGEGPRCEEDSDCLSPRLCVGGSCTPPCEENEECPGAQSCDLEQGRCREPESCHLDEDCLGQRVCEHEACQEAGCLIHSDCPAGEACVDRLCAAPLEGCPGCPEALECLEGACAPQLPCQGSADCPPGAPICDVGRCLSCLESTDCAPAEICSSGRCRIVAGCELESDCPGSRLCEQGFCQPSPCDEDLHQELLHFRSYSQLKLCDGSLDLYEVQLARDQGLQVKLRHPADQGDLNLAIRIEGQLYQSDDAWGLEQLSIPAAPEERLAELWVQGSPGVHVDYDLDLQPLSPEECAQDSLEGLFGNDSSEQASVAPGESFRLSLCPGEQDWIQAPLPLGAQQEFSLFGDQGAFEMSLRRENGDLIVEATEEEGELLLSSTEGGLLRLESLDEQPLNLNLQRRLSALVDSEERACAAPIPLPPNLSLPLMPHPPVQRFSGSCDGGFIDHLLEFELEEAERISLTLNTQGLGGALILRASCAEPESELRCEEGDDPQLNRLDLEAGHYSLIAQAEGEAQISLQIHALCEGDGECVEGLCIGGFCQPPCTEELGCEGAQRCEEGRCLEPERCEQDLDCLGPRVCEGGVCQEFGCELHADCEGACLDRRCLPRLPQACSLAEPCEGAQLCAPDGACLADGPCEEDIDCPEGAPRCAPDGGCVVCLSAEDCSPAEWCAEGRCGYSGRCLQDEDCPGSRLCEGGRCVASPCEGDRFEQLIEPSLEARAYGELMHCDGSVDRFSHHLAAGEGLRLFLRHDPNQGDLKLEVEGERISDGFYGLEIIELDPSPAPRTLQIIVRGRRGFHVPYSLSLEPQGPEFCAGDALEGLLGNQSLERARPLDEGLYELGLCPGDEDWFSVELPAGVGLQAQLTQTLGPPISLEILSPQGVPLAEAVEEGEETFIARHEFPSAAGALLHLQGQGAHAEFWLQLLAEPLEDAETLACAEAQLLRPAELLRLARRLAVERFALSCSRGGVRDYILRIDLEQARTLDIEVLGAGLETALALRSRCDDSGSELRCEAQEFGAQMQRVELEAGSWFLIIQTSAANPEVLMQWR